MELAEIGEEFHRTNLRTQTNKCENIVDGVIDITLEQGINEKIDLVDDIEGQVNEMKENTKGLFDNPDRITDINRHLRRILIKIAEDFGYKQELYDSSNNIKDNISTLFYWFRLVAEVNLGNDFYEIDHAYVIPQCHEERNENEHGDVGERIRPDLVGIGILSWYALEEILYNWQEAQSRINHDAINQIENDDEFKYGFISKLNETEGPGVPHSITRYDEGEEGNNIKFDPRDANFLPSEGDPVKFTTATRDGSPVAIEISEV